MEWSLRHQSACTEGEGGGNLDRGGCCGCGARGTQLSLVDGFIAFTSMRPRSNRMTWPPETDSLLATWVMCMCRKISEGLMGYSIETWPKLDRYRRRNVKNVVGNVAECKVEWWNGGTAKMNIVEVLTRYSYETEFFDRNRISPKSKPISYSLPQLCVCVWK